MEGVGGKKRELNVLEKLSAVIPELTHVKKLEFDEYLHIELLDEDPGAGGVVFDSVNAALDKETYLECTVSGERVFAAPLSYVLRPEGLFLYCCTRAGDYRLIPLSSVCDCVVSSVEFDRGEYVPYRKGFAGGLIRALFGLRASGFRAWFFWLFCGCRRAFSLNTTSGVGFRLVVFLLAQIG